MPDHLASSRMLVIGGSSGHRRGDRAQAAHAGARVTIAARSQERLTHALARLPQGVAIAVLDASDAVAVAAFFRAEAAWDHIVVTGSATRTGPARELPLADAHAAMQSKFWSAYHVRGRSARIAAGGSAKFVSGVYSVRPSATGGAAGRHQRRARSAGAGPRPRAGAGRARQCRLAEHHRHAALGPPRRRRQGGQVGRRPWERACRSAASPTPATSPPRSSSSPPTPSPPARRC